MVSLLLVFDRKVECGWGRRRVDFLRKALSGGGLEEEAPQRVTQEPMGKNLDYLTCRQGRCFLRETVSAYESTPSTYAVSKLFCLRRLYSE